MKNTISVMATLLLVLTTAVFTLALSPANESAGADTFKAKCAVCHSADGSGTTSMGQKMKVRDLRSPEVQKQSDEELAAIISNGRPPMPAYGKSLGAEKIRAVVAYIRSIATKS